MSEVNRVLEELPARYVQVILLHSRDGHTFEEIGRLLGKTPEAARKLWEAGHQGAAQRFMTAQR